MILTIIVFAFIFGYLIYEDKLYFKGVRYKYSVVMTKPDGKGYLDNDAMQKYIVYANSINDAVIKAIKLYAKDYNVDSDDVKVLQIKMIE
jgi:hypothetical protein